jgi:cobalt-zinc-cadmium efflux system outer membrane protein
VERRTVIWKRALIAIVAAAGTAAAARPAAGGDVDARVGVRAGDAEMPSARILAALEPGPRRELLAEVLGRNAKIAALKAQADAAEQRAPQVSALPDPMAALTAYLRPPETRVGPQRFMGSLSERFPWFGKLGLRERMALLAAAQASEKVEAARLSVMTEARRALDELGFLDEYEKIVRDDRATLSHYEELARARYSAGVGLEQSIVKLQAEITKDDARVLEIGTRRGALTAQLNALRDRPPGTPVAAGGLPAGSRIEFDAAAARTLALSRRPEITAADAGVEESETAVALARKEYAPDLTLGISYTDVGTRTDGAGKMNPPPDNGQDILAVSAGINLPIWRRKLAAGVEEAAARESASRSARIAATDDIDRALADLASRIPLTWQRVRLFEDVLIVQAEQSLRSAEAAYSSGTLHALDLLDAERVLLEVRIQSKRALADYDTAVAELEGAAAAPVKEISHVR